MTEKGLSIGKQTNAYKQKWEAEHYRQVKISVNRGLAEAFKADCEAAGVSMAGEISAFMSERCGRPGEIGTAVHFRRNVSYGDDTDTVSSKRKRRTAVKKILSQLEMIKDAQSAALENTPENLRGSDVYADAEAGLALIEETVDAIGALAETY
jgi:hypothetical protein